MSIKAAILASVALAVVIVCATGAFGITADFDDMPQSWCHGVREALSPVSANEPAKWSRRNDAICAKSCKGAFPRYKQGNWGIFSRDGLMCCCATKGSKQHVYHEREPHISRKAMAAMNIKKTDPLED